MVNPQIMGYDTENQVILSINFRKKKEVTVVWTWETIKPEDEKVFKKSWNRRTGDRSTFRAVRTSAMPSTGNAFNRNWNLTKDT